MNTINSNSMPMNGAIASKPPSTAHEAFAQQMARALGTNSATLAQNIVQNANVEQPLQALNNQKAQSSTPTNEAPRLGMVLDIRV